MKTCENCKHWIQMKELEGKCTLYGLKHCAWTPSEATCGEWEDGEIEVECCDEYHREVWEYDGFEYFGKTEPSKRKLCCTCKHRIPHVAYETCNIDNHIMGLFEILKRCCDRWEKDEGGKDNERHDIQG